MTMYNVSVDSLGNVHCNDIVCFLWIEEKLRCVFCPIAHLLNARFAYYICKEKMIEYDYNEQGES